MPGRVGVARRDELPSGGGELASRGVGRRDGRVVDVELREVWGTDWKRWRWAEEGRMKKLLEKLCFCSRWTRDAGRSRGRGRDWQGTTVCFVCHENEGLFLSLADGTKEILVENGLLRGKGRDAWSGTAMAALVLRGGRRRMATEVGGRWLKKMWAGVSNVGSAS